MGKEKGQSELEAIANNADQLIEIIKNIKEKVNKDNGDIQPLNIQAEGEMFEEEKTERTEAPDRPVDWWRE